MNKDQKISDDVKKTLSLLDNIKNIESNAFLFTRIKEEIVSYTSKKSFSSFDLILNLFRQIVFALLIVFNVYSVISNLSNGKVNEQYLRIYIKNVVSEYSIQTETDYLSNYEIKD
ncbi:MAG: hypothetical protein P4L35_15755 [Ignavibacteriaceae bacterium]|nr:hypothetical protein [Ignavibacteriaceae bacterium]